MHILSIEVLVILTVVAAAVIALCARPGRRGQAQTLFVTGALSQENAPCPPALHITCLDNGNVAIRRTGLEGMCQEGTIALAITKIGFDIEVMERHTPGPGWPATEATFTLNFLGREWYHIRWDVEGSQRHASFSLHVRPGLKTTVPLKE